MALNMKYFYAFLVGACIGTFLWFWPVPSFAFTGTMTDVTGSRALATEYENTSGNDIIVNAFVEGSAGNNYKWTAYIGTSAADTEIQECSGRITDYTLNCSFSFVVPDGYFYKISNTGASAGQSLQKWWEYETPVMSGGGGGGGGGTISPTVPIRFETFQAISFTLTASFCLFLLVQLLAWFIGNIFRRPARR